MLLLLLLSTALFATLSGVDSRQGHLQRRAQWLAVLMAPFGANARWQLSRLNFKLPGRGQWFPLGTFVANMAACCIDFALEVSAAAPAEPRAGWRHTHSHTQRLLAQASNNRIGFGYWGLVLVSATRVGFSGALSTVSTFVAEVGVGQLAEHAAVQAMHVHTPGILQVTTQLGAMPAEFDAYLYGVGSLVCGAVLGLVVYGWSVWSFL